MANEIRTRPPLKDIKILDRTETAIGHIKDVTVKTKDTANEVQSHNDRTVQQYASDKITHATETIASGTAYQAGIIVKKTSQTVRKKRKHDIRKRNVKKQAEEKRNNADRSVIRTSEDKDLLKIKTKKYHDIKGKNETIRAMEGSKHAVVNTSGSATKQVEKAKKLSAIATERARQAAKYTTKTIEAIAKKTVVIITSCIKALTTALSNLIAALGTGGSIVAFILVLVVLFGGVLCMIGGDNSSTVLPVSEEVKAYEPVIRQYAARHGISEYVELIKAIMMQESGGRGLDPMQSSESGYNTRFPRQPNGITDLEYSIECGVKAIKNCLEKADVENPMDMEHIKLALQGYNFGNGYISWAKNNYGGYSLSNAEEFSKIMAERMGWDSYGDTKYVPHVLRYYVFGRTPLGMGNQMIVAVAESQLGNIGGEPYWRWYGFESRVEWCACFVSWCADQCGYIDSGLVPKFAKCSEGAKWFQNQGRFLDGSSVPVVGSIIFFDWGDDGSVNHVGIVKKVEKGTVYTIEGNSGNKCRERSYSIGDNRIYGYGIKILNNHEFGLL